MKCNYLFVQFLCGSVMEQDETYFQKDFGASILRHYLESQQSDSYAVTCRIRLRAF